MAMTIIAGTLSSILQSRMKIHFFSLSLVLGKIILMGIVWWLSVQNIEFSQENLVELFFNFLWAGAFSNLIFLLLVIYFVQKEVIIHLKFLWEYCIKIIKTALPYGISLVLQTLYLRLDIVLISILLGSTATGIYAISGRIMESLLIIGVFFGQAILPKLSAIDDKKLSPEKNKQDKNLVLSWGIEKLFLLAMPIIIGGLFFAKDIILLLSSTDFTSEKLMVGADSLLQILLPIIILAFLNQLFSFALVGKNLQGKLLPINLTAMSLNLVLNLIYLPIYGILAAAWSTVLCEIIVFAWLLVIIKNNFKFIFSWEKWWRMILFNLIILAEILLTDLQENFKIAVVVCGLTYVLLVFWQRAKMFEMIQK
jgi:O-antigen/teichoic acid export membrane protein